MSETGWTVWPWVCRIAYRDGSFGPFPWPYLPSDDGAMVAAALAVAITHDAGVEIVRAPRRSDR